MARGPTFRKILFSREEVLREHLTYREQPAPVQPPVIPTVRVKRYDDDLKPDAGWMS